MLQLPTMHSPSNISPTPTFLNLDMTKTWNEMLTAKNKNDIYILTPYIGVPPDLSLMFWLTNLHLQYTI